MIHCRSVAHALAFLLLGTSGIAAQTEVPKFSARIQLVVSADEEIKTEIVSFLSRELRSLTDVLVTDDNPDYRIQILAFQMVTKAGAKVGVAFSVVVAKPLEGTLEGIALKRCMEEKGWEDIASKLFDTSQGLIIRHWLLTDSTDHLRAICQKIIADFDAQELEGSRKFWDKLRRGT